MGVSWLGTARADNHVAPYQQSSSFQCQTQPLASRWMESALGLDPSLVPCCFPEGHSQGLVPVMIIYICLALSCSLPLSHQLWGSWHPAQRHPVWDRLHVQQDRELSMQPRLPDGTPSITHHPLHQRWHVESEQARLQRCVPSFTWHCGFRSLCRAVLHPFCAQEAVPAILLNLCKCLLPLFSWVMDGLQWMAQD